MSFIESYKHLDKICGEMFETQYGVSAYIEDMLFLFTKHKAWNINRSKSLLQMK